MHMLTLLTMLAAGAAADDATYRDACMPAQWEAWSVTYEADGSSIGGHDRSNLYCYYDGRADLSEYRGLNDNNEPYYHGVSVTIWNEDRSSGRTLWAMVGTDGHTDIRISWDRDNLVSENEGRDPAGAFIGRTRSTYKPGGDFRFVMERSYDDGETWISPRNVIEYLKTPDAPPALPSDWASRLAGYAPSLVGEGGFLILDGFAWGKFVETGGSEPAGFIFASVAPKDEKWVWRTITWTSADGVTEVADIPLD